MTSPRRQPQQALLQAALIGACLMLQALSTVTAQTQVQSAPAPKLSPATHKPAKQALGTSFSYLADGSLLAVGLQAGKLALWRSADRGASFGSAELLPGDELPAADGEQRPRLLALHDGSLLLSYNRALKQRFSGDIRLMRSSDNGRSWSAPFSVQTDRQDLSHRFENMVQDVAGDVWFSWIDRRHDTEKSDARPNGAKYLGAAIYATRSRDGGKTVEPDFKLADHSCECCRVAMTAQAQGFSALWRHIFDGNARDHALATVTQAQALPSAALSRATFDDWRVDACPHHGPALAISTDATLGVQQHITWFGIRAGEAQVRYATLDAAGKLVREHIIDDPQAAHADVAALGQRVLVAWKSFDGERVTLKAMLSKDGGATFTQRQLSSGNAGDQPRILSTSQRFQVAWRTEAKLEVVDVE